MSVKENYKYTKDHEWLFIDDNGIATIGITAFAQGELGDIVFVEVETVGETLDKEEVFGSIEAVKTVSDMYMPISGEVVGFNEALTTNPELINKDPFGEGWIIKVKAASLSELDELLSDEDYKALINA